MTKIKIQQRAEAIKRMAKLKLKSYVIDDFFEKEEVFVSVYLNDTLNAVLQKPTDKMLQDIREFEKTFGGLVYHCQIMETSVGTLLTYLYVSSHKEEWDTDMSFEKEAFEGQGCYFMYVYVKNLTYPEYSEFGSVGIMPSSMGGVVRVY